METNRQIEIIIKEDGTVDFDQKGYKGKNCSGDIDDLVKMLGKQTSVKRKKEYYNTESVKIKNTL